MGEITDLKKDFKSNAKKHRKASAELAAMEQTIKRDIAKLRTVVAKEAQKIMASAASSSEPPQQVFVTAESGPTP